jgi:hypothetical protein
MHTLISVLYKMLAEKETLPQRHSQRLGSDKQG